MKVLVCDDRPERRAEIAQKIMDSGQPAPEIVDEQKLADELTALFKRARRCIKNPADYDDTERSCFQDIDIVILDNNLTHLPGDGQLLTAESIAGYIRAFTNAKYIVSLNVNPDVDFDLRYLVGDFSTRADLALNTDHLSNPALWSGKPSEATLGFLPWYWPALMSVATRRSSQIDFIKQHLDEPVLPTLGFDGNAIAQLSPHARGALSPVAGAEADTGPDVIAIDKLTFRDVFIAKDRSLPIKDDREKLSHAVDTAGKAVLGIISRVVAADLDLWFRRDVAGPQDPLIDVGHLLVRLPFLLGERVQGVDAWNAAITTDTPPYGLDESLYSGHLAPARFQYEMWVKAPSFWWPKIKADKDLNERFLNVKADAWPDLVFCEDRSTFLTLAPEGHNGPVEFAAEFEGAWSRRYVARVEGAKYAPRSRLAL